MLSQRTAFKLEGMQIAQTFSASCGLSGFTKAPLRLFLCPPPPPNKALWS
ncbi:mCG147260 [Mus musculus]|nr:mCG147260 [Mus musculus]